ncbi:MAG: energy-coupling factor ABC transporter ATP-binding protein, partial [Bombilactobacillus sp.]|nr:energy-coupling factor ABC transporter ATP-binding protein [Bombilactobacillus sp.]
DEANMADNIIVMNDGKLITQGNATKVFSQVKLLKEIGLDVPFFQQVMDDLRSDSITIPETINSEEELVKYLCQLNSNK